MMDWSSKDYKRQKLASSLKGQGPSCLEWSLLKSGVGPSMDLVIRRHRLPNESLLKEAMRTSKDNPKKKVKNVVQDPAQGKSGKLYMPDQKINEMQLHDKSKGVKRERKDA